MKTERMKRNKAVERNIGKMAECLGNVRRCDTTSAICSKGKLSIVEKNSAAREIARTFVKPDAIVDEVGETGLKLFVMLYSGKKSDTLSSLRYVRDMKMASCSSTLNPEKLPPSERAAWFHALRAYYQVQE